MYIVEGNIGVGKSTFLKIIKNNFPKLEVEFEPVGSWHCEDLQKSLLSLFYKDPKRWAYTMEINAMTERAFSHKKNNKTKIIERSVYSGHYCFSLNGYEEGFMTQAEWYIYNKIFEMLVLNKISLPKGFIYLKAEPEICLERIKKRSRSGESSISLDYLTKIHQKHEQFLIHKIENKDTALSKQLFNIPVLTIDCNEEFENNINKCKDMILSLEKYFSKQ